MHDVIIAVMIFGIVMIVVVLFYNVIFGFSKERFTQEQCQASLLLTRSVDPNQNWWCVAGAPNPVPLKCNRDFITVHPTGVDEGKLLSDYDYNCPAGFESRSCVGHAVIATEMASCWDTFLTGEQVIFQQAEERDLKLNYWRADGKACFVCSEITLRTEEDVQRFSEYTRLAQWNKDTTYYDHFNTPKALCMDRHRGTDGACWTTYAQMHRLPIDQDTFKVGEKYAIVFIREGLSTCVEGDESQDGVTFTVQAVPADRLNDYCNKVLV